jgi:phosphate:Na+ symporter
MNVGLVSEMAFHVVGGLGIFLLGMKYMQQGLQVVAGDSIRRMINALTANRFLAVGVGLFITTLVQSSSVTSVMVIGLVNSELMALNGAIGVIIGANIGTTITGWMLALKIGQYGLPLLGLAAFGWLFIKGEKLRYSALAMLGIGMVFFGLELMKDGFEPVSDLPEFASMFQMFEATDYLGVLKSALVGCVVTLAIQSSSATLGITIALANTGVVDFQTAGALVLGTNVGTTVTAYLASLGADDVNAKRTAYFHIMFNVAGVAAITALFLPVYLPFIDNVVMAGADPNMQLPGGAFPYMTAGIAAVHTVFNVVTALLFIPFVTPIANALSRLVKDKPLAERVHLTHLDFSLVSSPLIAIEQSGFEISRTDQHVRAMLDDLRTIVTDKREDRDLVEKTLHRERIIDDVQSEVTRFLTDLLSADLSHRVAEEARTQLRLADEFESVSDYVTSVLKLYLRLKEANVVLSPVQQEELLELHDAIAAYYDRVHEGFAVETFDEYLAGIRRDSRKITDEIRALRNRHWSRLSHETVVPLVSTSYMDIANAYRRIKDHLLNVGEAIVGGKDVRKRSIQLPEEVASD